MPRPAYVICSQTGSIDERTNRASFFNVIESIDVVAINQGVDASLGSKSRPPFTMSVLSAWIKTDGDTDDQVFESDLVCNSETGQILFESPPTRFKFMKAFHRLYNFDMVFEGVPSLGVYEVVARIRRTGETEWIARQSFSFVVREVSPKKD